MNILKKVWGYWWGKVVFVVVGMVAVSWGLAVVDRKATGEQVAKIHATKLTMDDVIGKNLPPDPGAEADKTVAGIDANKNGIRDDVELAIFKEYPDSAKTRAVLLQYALALQMEMVQPVVNRDTVGEVANKQDRAIFCVAKIVHGRGEDSVFFSLQKYSGPLFNKQFNTRERNDAHKKFYSYLNTGRIDDPTSCDLELSLFES